MKNARVTLNKEIKALASSIDELVQDYTPPLARLHLFANGLQENGWSIIGNQSAKMFMTMSILNSTPELLEDHISSDPFSALGTQLLMVEISQHVPISSIKKSFRRARIKWVELAGGDLALISTVFSEDKLADIILEYWNAP